MIEKGKGRHVENLRIIQLCEADLNFVLHMIWGHRLIRHAMKHNALDPAKFALPGQTCNNAALSKTLFLDLSRQTLTPRILTDYDAMVAFDRVLLGLSIITCQRVGLRRMAGTFMYSLLKEMYFYLITGFGQSTTSFCSNQDGVCGQGVLQWSSSAFPINIFNSDVSLSAYRKNGIGAAFYHPITETRIEDSSVQFLDDTLQFLNPIGTNIDTTECWSSHSSNCYKEFPVVG
jgi:hypothetical protein